MTEHAITFPFRKRCLATAIGLFLTNPSYALQALSDDSLSNTTGEGVALVLDDFKMVFQQPNDLSTGSSYTRGLENPSQYDTGFIRIIPTGRIIRIFQNIPIRKFIIRFMMLNIWQVFQLHQHYTKVPIQRLSITIKHKIIALQKQQ